MNYVFHSSECMSIAATNCTEPIAKRKSKEQKKEMYKAGKRNHNHNLSMHGSPCDAFCSGVHHHDLEFVEAEHPVAVEVEPADHGAAVVDLPARAEPAEHPPQAGGRDAPLALHRVHAERRHEPPAPPPLLLLAACRSHRPTSAARPLQVLCVASTLAGSFSAPAGGLY